MKKKQYLQELLDLTESPVVTTYEKGNYVDSIRQVYIKLQNIKVGTNNIKKVIEALLGDLTIVTIYGPLPSAALTPMLLQQYAGEVETEVSKVSVSGFEEMNERAKKIYTSIDKLRCNLHFLLG